MNQEGERQAAFWSQLQQRKVFRVVVSYAVVAFVVIQIADATFEALAIPASAIPWLLSVMFFAFPFVVSIAWLFEVTPSGLVRDIRFARFPRPVELLFVILLYTFSFSLAGFFAWIGWGDDVNPQVQSRDKPTIAVLPFQDFSSTGGASYLGSGIAEQLLTVLDKIDEFEVVGRTSSFLHGRRELDISELGALLGADHIVEGSVVLDDPRVLINVQLIESGSSLHVWSESYERTLDSLIDLEREIASEIASSMKVVLSENSSVIEEPPLTENTLAYLYYLQGKEYLRRPASEETLTFAEELFRSALSEDPDMSSADVGLCQSQLGLFRITRKPHIQQLAIATCVRVAASKDQTADAHTALGDLNRLLRAFDEAEQEFSKALELDPHSARAMHGLARAFQGQNRLDLAEEAFLRSIDMEPSWAFTHRGYGFFLAKHQRMEAAAEQFRRATQLAPDDFNAFANLGLAYFELGEWTEARTAFGHALELRRSSAVLVSFANLLYYEGDFGGAAELLEEALLDSGPDYWTFGKLGAAYRQLGNSEKARGAFAEAVTLGREALVLSPDDGWLLSYVAGYEANLGRFTQAQELLGRARQVAPELPDIEYFAAITEILSGGSDVATYKQQALRLGYPEHLLEADPMFYSMSDK